MALTTQTLLARLFSNAKPSGPAPVFSWRLIRRQRRPFLLLPESAPSHQVSLTIYSAQRRRAKVWRALLPLLLRTPLARIFQRIQLPVNAQCDLVRFLAGQAGMPASELAAPAIKFGGLNSQKSRLVLLVCDASNRPLKVIKVGLDAVGRAATDYEAGLLAQLPPGLIGCTRVTGRLVTPDISAFATDFFPGASPENDVGMEILFHSWINAGPAVPVEKLAVWQELETDVARIAPAKWAVLRAALAGQNLRSTLYHGDFAPWNIRVVNSQNLQAFDWERGNLQGLPAWDWFHFVVQTSILARRHSIQRVAAEVEELLASPRFEKYLVATGIQSFVKPLLLAYLLHHRWVVKPLDGWVQMEQLYELLAERWNLAPRKSASERPRSEIPTGFWADAGWQLQAAWSQLANVFWEPTLTATNSPPLLPQLKSAWPLVTMASFWVAAVAGVQFLTNHLLLLPLYAAPALLATRKINRGWGTVFALPGALLGPVVATVKDPEHQTVDRFCWNTLMRFIILQLCVFLWDRSHQPEGFFRHLHRRRPADFAKHWAIILLSCGLLFVIAWGDLYTGPRINFLPLYLIPAALLTLFLNLRSGMLVALGGALVACLDEYSSQYNTNVWEVFGWNFPMRFLMLFTILYLLDRVRVESVLFTPWKPNGVAKAAPGGKT